MNELNSKLLSWTCDNVFTSLFVNLGSKLIKSVIQSLFSWVESCCGLKIIPLILDVLMSDSTIFNNLINRQDWNQLLDWSLKRDSEVLTIKRIGVKEA